MLVPRNKNSQSVLETTSMAYVGIFTIPNVSQVTEGDRRVTLKLMTLYIRF